MIVQPPTSKYLVFTLDGCVRFGMNLSLQSLTSDYRLSLLKAKLRNQKYHQGSNFYQQVFQLCQTLMMHERCWLASIRSDLDVAICNIANWQRARTQQLTFCSNLLIAISPLSPPTFPRYYRVNCCPTIEFDHKLFLVISTASYHFKNLFIAHYGQISHRPLRHQQPWDRNQD